MNISRLPNGIELDLEGQDTLLLSNSLNEVCNGFRIRDFERVIGVTHDQICSLLERFRKLGTDHNSKVALTDRELRALQGALRGSLNELCEEEFSTRTGCDFTIGQEILRAFVSFH